jgi:hypothetical protein
MRITHIISILTLCLTSLLFAQSEKYIQPKDGLIGIYANQTRKVYEEPLFKADQSARLLVIAEKGSFYQVKSPEGQTGWVEKRLCINLGKSKTFKFESADVIGYLDNPTPVYILDSDDPNAERIYLDRSFKDALRDNTDKETVERQTTK